MKPIIGIEKSQTQIKLVEVDISAKPPKLLNFAPIGLPSDNELEAIKYVKEVSASYRFKGHEVAITEAGDFAEHRIIDLPPIKSKKNLDQVINREVRTSAQASTSEADLAMGYKVVGKKMAAGPERNEVLIVTAPQEITRRLSSFVDRVGWKTKLVTIPQLAILSLIRSHPNYDPKAIVAFILLDEYVGHLLIGMGDKILYYRALPFPLESSEERVEKFAIEINRSILHFGQRSRGAGRINQVLVCGNRDILPAINVALSGILEQSIDIFDLSALLDLSPLGDRALEFETISASFSIPIGAALELNQELPINLLPKKVREQSSQLKTNLIMGSMVAMTLLAAASTQVYLSIMKAKYVKLSNEQRKKIQELQPLLKEVDQVQKEKEVHQQQQNFLKKFSPGGEWESMLNIIATIIPSDVSLISLDIIRQGDKWEVSIKGQAETENLSIAFSELNQFYYGLRQLPFFSEVSMEPPKVISPFGSRQASGASYEISAPNAEKEKEKIALSFEIQGILTEKPLKLSELFRKN